MIYILILYWYGATSGAAGKTALAVEFNNAKSCLAAAEAIRKQKSPDVIVCSPKGQKP